MSSYPSAWDRFWPQVDAAECWIWGGKVARDGYGHFFAERKTYTPENTRMHNGKRHCRECGRAACREFYRRKHAKAIAL